MFLSELNKKEGIGFLQLFTKLANADNDFSEKEKELYSDYLKELNIKEAEIPDVALEEVILTLKGSDVRKKNIIYFELVGLALIDGEFDEREQLFLADLGNKLSIQVDKRLAFVDYFENALVRIKYSTEDADSNISLLKEEAESLLK